MRRRRPRGAAEPGARHRRGRARPSSSSSLSSSPSVRALSTSGTTAAAMLASLLLLVLLALLAPTADAGALPLAFFRQLQRLPYFGHGAGGRYDTNSAASKQLLSDAKAAAHHHAPPPPPSKPQHGAGAGAGAGIRPVGPKEEAKRKEQEKHRPHPLHRPPHAYSDRPINRTAAEGARIVVPPPTAAGGNASSAAGTSAHPHVHHWGLRGDGYHAVMAGKWTAGQWHALEAPMNQSLSMGDLLPSRHRRPHASKGRAAAQPQQQRGEDLLHGAHQLMKGMRAGAERPDVTAIWRSLLLPPTGPGGRSSSNRKIHAPRAAATTSGSSSGSTGGKKGVSPSPLYILVSQQSACGMLLRSLDDSLRRLVELVDRLPSPTPAVLPASLLSQTYLWHLSPPFTTTTAQWGQAPHLAGAVHLATLHAVRLEMGPAAGTGTGAGGALGNGTHVAGDPLINPIAACSTLTHSPLIRAYQGRPYHSHPFRSRSISHIYRRPPHHLKAPRGRMGAPYLRSRGRGGSSGGKMRSPVSVSPRTEGEAYLGSYKLLYYPEGLPLLAREEDYNFFYALSAAAAGTGAGARLDEEEDDEEEEEEEPEQAPSWRRVSATAAAAGVERVRGSHGTEQQEERAAAAAQRHDREPAWEQEQQQGHEAAPSSAACDCAHKDQQQQQQPAPEAEEQGRHHHHHHAGASSSSESAKARWESSSSRSTSSGDYSGSSGWGLASQALAGAAALLFLPILAILGITFVIARLLLQSDDEDAADRGGPAFAPGATVGSSARRHAAGGLILPPPSPSLASSAYSSRCVTPRTGGGGAKALHLHSPRSTTNNWTASLRGSMPPPHPHGAGAITPRSGLASPHATTHSSVPGSPSHARSTTTGGGRRTEPGSPAAAGAGAGGSLARRPPFYPSSPAPSHISNHSISVFSTSPLSSRGASPSTVGSPRSVASSRGGSVRSRRGGARPDKINGRSVKWTTSTGGVGVGGVSGVHKAMAMSAPAPQQIIRER